MNVPNRPIQVFPIWRVVIGGLIVVGICSILCWGLGWCWWCRDCPDCPDVDCGECGGGGEIAAQIILEDMHAGVWMVQENLAFHFDPVTNPPEAVACDGDPAKATFGACEGNYAPDDEYRHGVLFQMGPVVQRKTVGGVQVDRHYGGVKIEHDAGETWLLPGDDPDFDWLDVIEAGTNCVIDPANAYEMVHNLADENRIREHIDGTLLTPVKPHGDDIVENACDSTAYATQEDLSCPRSRSIHSSLLPTRIITYWAGHGPDFYEMAAKPTNEIVITTASGSTDPSHERQATDKPHVSYNFQLPEEVVVDRWMNGCWKERYTGVTLIRILFNKPSSYDAGYPHKPVDGGK